MRSRTLVLLPLLLTSAALAGGVPIRTVLSGSGGQVKTTTDSFMVMKRTSDLKPFHLNVLLTNTVNDRITDVILAVKVVKLSPAEFDLLRGNVSYVATRCFGLDTAQLPALNAWVTQQNAAGGKRVTATFGKVNAVFIRQDKPGSPYTTVELYRDTDRPGVTPWLNYCTR